MVVSLGRVLDRVGEVRRRKAAAWCKMGEYRVEASGSWPARIAKHT